jgi:hypothetical protein
VKAIGDGGERFQLSYGAATGKAFRPERVGAGEVTLAAVVMCQAVEDN